jgi:hypothetical protein
MPVRALKSKITSKEWRWSCKMSKMEWRRRRKFIVLWRWRYELENGFKFS